MADQKNWRSKTITGGVARAPNRAMLRAVGFKDGDFDKPIVGVANGHSTMNPATPASSRWSTARSRRSRRTAPSRRCSACRPSPTASAWAPRR